MSSDKHENSNIINSGRLIMRRGKEKLKKALSAPSENNGDRYHYKPLRHPNSIRLLELQPAEITSPIRVVLQESQLVEGLTYEAVSYCWATEDGDAELSSTISCKGTEDGGTELSTPLARKDTWIKITKNCEATLRGFRHINHTRVLWVDAICIDQENTEERSQQVGLMRLIYSHASQVLIWLGNASRKIDKETKRSVTDIFLDHVTNMAQEMQHLKANGESPRDSLLYQTLLQDIRRPFIDGVKPTLYKGFDYIVNCRWWERVWVVQEAFVAKQATIYCGKGTTSHDALEVLISTVVEDESREGCLARTQVSRINPHYDVCHEARQHNQPDQTRSLNVLYLCRALEASDPRDKIFGLAGLMKETEAIIPPTDYTQDALTVFTTTFKCWQERSVSLEMLFMATKEKQVLGWPSWLPDWSLAPCIPYFISSQFFNRAARVSKASWKFLNHDKEFCVKGIQVDLISEITMAAPKAYGVGLFLMDAIPGWIQSCRLWERYKGRATKASKEDAFWRTLCWDTEYFGGLCPLPSELESTFEEWYQIVTSGKSIKSIYNQLRALPRRFEHHVVFLPICMTAEGRWASVPPTTQAGDHIVLLAGAHMPFVLRPVGHTYMLVGHCYVHGIMQGEAFPEDEEDLDWISIGV